MLLDLYGRRTEGKSSTGTKVGSGARGEYLSEGFFNKRGIG